MILFQLAFFTHFFMGLLKPRFWVYYTTYTIPLLHRSFVSSEKQVMCPNFFSQSVAINPDTKFSLQGGGHTEQQSNQQHLAS